MAKGKNLVPFIPPTEEEIMLIQPNNVTFGQYNISEWQETCLLLSVTNYKSTYQERKNCHGICLTSLMLL